MALTNCNHCQGAGQIRKVTWLDENGEITDRDTYAVRRIYFVECPACEGTGNDKAGLDD